jgi:hypothetical protein
MKLLLDLHEPECRPPDRPRPIGGREGLRASLILLPRDFGLAGETNGKGY